MMRIVDEERPDWMDDNFIYFGEITEFVHTFLYIFKETGKNPTTKEMKFYVDDGVFDFSLPETLQITDTEMDEEEDVERVRLWNYNCPECNRFLLLMDEVHALQFSTRHGAYHYLCGKCMKKMEMVKSL